jgi:hypothetical protein
VDRRQRQARKPWYPSLENTGDGGLQERDEGLRGTGEDRESVMIYVSSCATLGTMSREAMPTIAAIYSFEHDGCLKPAVYVRDSPDPFQSLSMVVPQRVLPNQGEGSLR